MQYFERRLPIFILIDCSESMVGGPMDAVQQGLQQLCFDLKTDPTLIEVAWLSVITFSSAARQEALLIDVLNFNPPKLSVGPGTCLGSALDLLTDRIAQEVRRSTPTQKGDWKPVVFLLTDGLPTDNWRDALTRFKTATARDIADFIAVGCGKDADVSMLREITPTVVLSTDLSVGQMKKLFRMVSTSVAAAAGGGKASGLSASGLPAGLVLAETGSAPSGAAKILNQIILAARCRDTGKGYLMRYQRTDSVGGKYEAEGAYPVGSEYFKAAGGSIGQSIDASQLTGSPPCPYCKRKGWTTDTTGIVCADSFRPEVRRAQVVFLLDCTGSMEGEIRGVKESMAGFMDYIHSEGLSVEAGLIAFRDLQENEPAETLRFREGVFTHDAREFKSKMSPLTARGGGNNPGESCFDAIVRACRLPFAADAAKILIVITDEPPLRPPDGEARTVEDVPAALSNARIDQLHFVIPRELAEFYGLFHGMVSGEIFPLDEGGREAGSFRKILLNVGKSITVATRIG